MRGEIAVVRTEPTRCRLTVWRAAAISLTVLLMPIAPARTSAQPSTVGSPVIPQGDRIEVQAVPGPGDIDIGRAIAVVAAPLERVMQVVTDYARYPEFMPNFNQSRVLSRRGPNALVYMQARIARNTTTLWAQMRIYARRPRGQTRIIEGRMVQGNMATMYARWELTPLGPDRTIVQFELLVDPDLPVPDALVSAENVKAARNTLRALRRRLEPQRTG
ncbi:MAG: SRPBCC family protein [Myxococcota bacterium]|nr:SRPBCC family protein [Myxococcota bacterium]MDW8362592.1 SRPBCC family protein [Myxococcales bacterium]